VLDSLLVEALPATRNTIALLADSLERTRGELIASSEVRERSRALGRRIGLGVVAWSREDRFAETRGRRYNPPVGEGLWVNDAPPSLYAAQNLSGATEFVGIDNPANTLRPGSVSDRSLVISRPKRPEARTLPPVNMAGATEPYWGEVRPFVLRTWNECEVPDPPAYFTEPGSPLYQQAKAVYDTWAGLTPEQRTIALFWADNPGETGTPSGHWLAIASQVVSQERLPATQAARVFALTAMAQADAFIAVWGYKYRFNLIRPRTYIRRVIDPAWEPQIPTPPFPEYPAGHAAQSAAAAGVLAALIGERPFDDSTGLAIGHEVRRFRSFREAADEAAQSRLYGGIHFPVGNAVGRELGRCIAGKVIERTGGAAAR
jgi:hypothetical protein